MVFKLIGSNFLKQGVESRVQTWKKYYTGCVWLTCECGLHQSVWQAQSPRSWPSWLSSHAWTWASWSGCQALCLHSSPAWQTLCTLTLPRTSWVALSPKPTAASPASSGSAWVTTCKSPNLNHLVRSLHLNHKYSSSWSKRVCRANLCVKCSCLWCPYESKTLKEPIVITIPIV